MMVALATTVTSEFQQVKRKHNIITCIDILYFSGVYTWWCLGLLFLGSVPRVDTGNTQGITCDLSWLHVRQEL